MLYEVITCLAAFRSACNQWGALCTANCMLWQVFGPWGPHSGKYRPLNGGPGSKQPPTNVWIIPGMNSGITGPWECTMRCTSAPRGLIRPGDCSPGGNNGRNTDPLLSPIIRKPTKLLIPEPPTTFRITSYNVCYTKLLRTWMNGSTTSGSSI